MVRHPVDAHHGRDDRPRYRGEELRHAGLLEQVGGTDYLHALQNDTPSISAAGKYGTIVIHTARHRDLIHIAGDLAEIGYSEPDPDYLPAQIATLLQRIEGATSDDHDTIGLIDWTVETADAVELLDGVLFEGRWTSGYAAAKTGKSTWCVHLGVHLSDGIHPHDRTALAPIAVAHLDAELGRVDLGALVRNCGYEPADLVRWHATDLPPTLNTPAGAARALRTIRKLDARLIIIDGINGVVEGPEKDDTTWRPFYDLFVRPLKADRRALLTLDNTGHEAGTDPADHP